MPENNPINTIKKSTIKNTNHWLMKPEFKLASYPKQHQEESYVSRKNNRAPEKITFIVSQLAFKGFAIQAKNLRDSFRTALVGILPMTFTLLVVASSQCVKDRKVFP